VVEQAANNAATTSKIKFPSETFSKAIQKHRKTVKLESGRWNVST